MVTNAEYNSIVNKNEINSKEKTIMTNSDVRVIEKIKGQYTPKNEEQTELDKLKTLNKQVKRPVQAFSYVFGTIGALVLGTGMAMAMSLIPGGMIAGVAIGCTGIAVAGTNYPLHNKLMNRRKKKYSKEILELSNSILNESK